MNPERSVPIETIERILRARREGADVAPMLAELDSSLRPQVESALAAEEALFGSPERSGADVASDERRIGPYRLLRLLGRGGQGTIWLAEDSRLKRKVALKILEHLGAISEERLARFQREAEVTSRLDHPGICPIYETGRVGSCAWLAMRYVAGSTLRDVELPASLDRRFEIVEQAARALHVAHEEGIVHRDVKPANLMLTPGGDVVVLDFGLAGDVAAQTETLTRAQGSFGTPAYSSPEQVRGGGHELDRRSDVWSLGVILYELCTGQRPFSGATLDALYRSILDDSPRDPRAVNRKLQSDACVVIAKALAKRPEDRYPTALALAQDLQRLRMRRPIQARRATLARRVQRWAEREPKLAVAVGAIVLCLGSGLVVTSKLLAQARGALRTARSTTALAEAQLLATRDPSAALELALTSASAAPRALVNDALLEILDAVQLVRTFDGGGGSVRHCDASATGDLVLSSAEGGGVRVFSTATGALVRRLERAPTGGVPALFAAGGDEVVTGGEDGAIRRFAVATGIELANFEADVSAVTELALRPGGADVAVGCEGGVAALFRLSDGECRARLDGLGSAVAGLSFTANGAKLVIVTSAGRVLILDAEQGQLASELARHPSMPKTELLDVAVSPDGTRIVAACLDNMTWNWSMPPAPPQDFGLPTHDAAVTCVAFSPDGAMVASGSLDRAVHITALDSLLVDRIERSATAPIRSIVFTRDSRHLLAASDDGKLRMLRSRRLPELARFEFLAPTIAGATFSPDGRWIASWARDVGARLWSARSGQLVKAFLDYPSPYNALAFRPDSRVLALPTKKGLIRFADTSSGEEVARFAVPAGVPEPPIGLSFDATGARLLVTSGDGEAWLLDGDDGSPRASLRGLPSLRPTGTVARSDFDAAGERVATVDRDGERDVVKVWSTADGTVLRELRGDWRRVASLDFSPRAPRLVVACDDGCARLFDLEKGGEPLRLDCEGANVDCATFDVAGERVATAASDGATRLFEPRTGRLLATLRGHEGVVHSACFSPDGRELVTAGWDGVAIVWDARSGERLAMQQSHHRPILCAEFAPDGATVISAGLDGYVRRWPADPLAFARKLAAESQ